jgi:GNAT superfamily N-acetyltransferase
MVRISRAAFPAFPLPAGFTLAWYQPGNQAWWEEIQRRSDSLARVTSDLFWSCFGQAAEALPRRQCYLLDAQAKPIGTATAWFDRASRGECWGRLHWVAIVPEWQGQGLAKPLLATVCARLRELHPEKSFLRTAARRLPAISLYLKFGFQPEIRTPDEERLWRSISAALGKPVGLSSRL